MFQIKKGTSNSIALVMGSCHGKYLCLKLSINPRVPFAEQKNRYEVLKSRFPRLLPRIISSLNCKYFGLLVTKSRAGKTLADLLESDNVELSKLLAVWNEALETLGQLWQDSASAEVPVDVAPRNHQQRVSRVRLGLEQYFKTHFGLLDVMDRPWNVNGESLPSLGETLDRLRQISKPQQWVLCHGDPQPTNIIVEPPEWCFIDWEWSGQGHDWRMMVSHLYGWWIVEHLRTSKRPNFNLTNGQFELGYSSTLDERYHPFQTSAINLFQSASSRLGDSNNFGALKLYLATLLLGDVRFAGKAKAHAASLALIGEALRLAWNSCPKNVFQSSQEFRLH